MRRSKLLELPGARLRAKCLIERAPTHQHLPAHSRTANGVAIFYTKVHDRLLRPAAGRPSER